MEVKTIKIERNYYIADDGKRFEHEDDCLAYERRILLGVKEIEDTTFLNLYLDILALSLPFKSNIKISLYSLLPSSILGI